MMDQDADPSAVFLGLHLGSVLKTGADELEYGRFLRVELGLGELLRFGFEEGELSGFDVVFPAHGHLLCPFLCRDSFAGSPG
jgi:hypothetical protein